MHNFYIVLYVLAGYSAYFYVGRFRYKPAMWMPEGWSLPKLIWLILTWTLVGACSQMNLYRHFPPEIRETTDLFFPILNSARHSSIVDLIKNYLWVLVVEDAPRYGFFWLLYHRPFARKPIGLVVAALLSSIPFVLLHQFSKGELILMTLLVGLLLNATALRFGVLVCSIFHVAINHYSAGVFFPCLGEGNVLLALFVAGAVSVFFLLIKPSSNDILQRESVVSV